MLAGVYVLNGGGVVVSGTATSVHVERGEFDLDYAVTTIDVGRTFLGPELDEIEVYTAVPFFRMEEGRSYLLFVNPTASVPGKFTPVDTYLFEAGENGWVARDDPAPDQSAPLVLQDAQVVDLIKESRHYMVEVERGAPNAG